MSLLVVVDDFDGFRAGVGPLKTNPILLVDPDAMLTLSVAFERFQAVSRRNPQILKSFDRVQLLELPQGEAHHLLRQSSGTRQSLGRRFEASTGRNSVQASGSTVHIALDTSHSPSIFTKSTTSTPQWLVSPSIQNS